MSTATLDRPKKAAKKDTKNPVNKKAPEEPRQDKQPELPGTPTRGAAYRAAQDVLQVQDDLRSKEEGLETRKAEVRKLMKDEDISALTVEHPDDPGKRFTFLRRKSEERLSIRQEKEGFKK